MCVCMWVGGKTIYEHLIYVEFAFNKNVQGIGLCVNVGVEESVNVDGCRCDKI